MARIKRLSSEDARELRRGLHEDVEAGGVPISEAVRRMREALAFSQARFGTAFGLTTRQVWELENGTSNPTLETLAKLGKPFGFQVGFVLRSPDTPKPAPRTKGKGDRE